MNTVTRGNQLVTKYINIIFNMFDTKNRIGIGSIVYNKYKVTKVTKVTTYYSKLVFYCLEACSMYNNLICSLQSGNLCIYAQKVGYPGYFGYFGISRPFLIGYPLVTSNQTRR